MPEEPATELSSVVALLEAGQEPDELRLLALLRRPECPRVLVERLCGCRWVRGRRRLAALLVRHPACAHTFAWQVLPHLSWHDLHEVSGDPRTPPAVRAQAERKLTERLPSMSLGERVALARVASHGVVRALLADPEVRCVEALLDNPRFTEEEALRLLHANPNVACLTLMLRHPSWGRRRAVVRAAVRLGRLPLGVLLGLAATLTAAEQADLVRGEDLPEGLRHAVRELLDARREGGTSIFPSAPS